MKQVDEIIYDAIRADEELTTAISGHVVSTCFEVSPTDADNTPLPYIIVTDDGFQNQVESKDDKSEVNTILSSFIPNKESIDEVLGYIEDGSMNGGDTFRNMLF